VKGAEESVRVGSRMPAENKKLHRSECRRATMCWHTRSGWK